METTTWKLIGLGLTAALGVIGTITDTKEKTDTGYKIRPVGWWVAAGIVASSMIGGIAQHADDQEAFKVRQNQLATLDNITSVSNSNLTMSERNLTRFSGQLRIKGFASLSVTESSLKMRLKKYKTAYERYLHAKSHSEGQILRPSDKEVRAAIQDVLRQINLVVRFPDEMSQRNSEFYAELSGAAIHWDIGYGEIGDNIEAGDSLTVAWSGVPMRVDNHNMLSVSDFCNRSVHVSTGATASLFNMDKDDIDFIDDASHLPITSTKLAKSEDWFVSGGVVYEGQTEEYKRP